MKKFALAMLSATMLAAVATSCSKSDSNEVMLTPQGIEGESADMLSVADPEVKLGISTVGTDTFLVASPNLVLPNPIPGYADFTEYDVQIIQLPAMVVLDEFGTELIELPLGAAKSDDPFTDLTSLILSDGAAKGIPFSTPISSAQAADILAKAKSFKIKDVNVVHTELVTMSGGIGPYPIVMTLRVNPDRDDVFGMYYYSDKTPKGPESYMYITGELGDDEKLLLYEFDNDGQETGLFEGDYYSGGSYDGFMSAKSGNYKVQLMPDDSVDPIDITTTDFSRFRHTPGFNPAPAPAPVASGGSEVDRLIDQFENCVNRYVALAQKAANGVMNAYNEALVLMNDVQNLMLKLAPYQGQLTDAQKRRGQAISAKLNSVM